MRAAEKTLVELLPNYLLQNPDDARARIFFAATLARLGRNEEAMREGTAALELSPGDPMMLYNCACLYTRLDEAGRALDTLERAIGMGYENFRWMQQDPDLDPLRSEPRFQAMTQGR
jgi:Flp pilus assembly protein TadD